MLTKIFIVSFLCACFFQGVHWYSFGSIDDVFWSDEARFVQTDDVRQYDATKMYGYPGRPLLDGTRFLHTLFHLSYPTALIVFMTICNAGLIACITVFIQTLRGDILWTVGAFALLALSPLYAYATPPSAITPLSIVLLCLLSLSIYEKRAQEKRWVLIAWPLVLGATIATRIDIGLLGGAFFAVVVLAATRRSTALAMFAGTVVAFLVFDPYMYYMPIRHLRDLFEKVVYHYADIKPTLMELSGLWSVSWLMLISISLGLGYVLFRRSVRPPIASWFILLLTVFTVLQYAILLTARNQGERYFLPVALIWQTFLPLFLLGLAPRIDFSFVRTVEGKERARKLYRLGVPGILAGYEIIMFTSGWVFNHIYWVEAQR